MQVSLIGKVEPYSILKGRITPNAGGGDGQATIRELLDTALAKLEILNDDRFNIDLVR